MSPVTVVGLPIEIKPIIGAEGAQIVLTRRELLVASTALLLKQPERLRARQVLFPDRPWEKECCMPYSGGLVRDERGYLRLYYLANFRHLAMAVSVDDGATWRKPDLGYGHNIVLRPDGPVDAISVALRPHGGTGDAPSHPYAALVTSPGLNTPRCYVSWDGLAWAQCDTPAFLAVGDRSSLAWHRDRWLLFARIGGGTGGDPRRFALYQALAFPTFTLVDDEWLRCDEADGESSQLYGVDLIGGTNGNKLALTIWRGAEPGRPKLNDVCLGLLRDDLTVVRDYEPVAKPGAPGAWNYGNVQGVAGGAFQAASGAWRMLVSGRSGDGTGGNGTCSTGMVTL